MSNDDHSSQWSSCSWLTAVETDGDQQMEDSNETESDSMDETGPRLRPKIAFLHQPFSSKRPKTANRKPNEIRANGHEPEHRYLQSPCFMNPSTNVVKIGRGTRLNSSHVAISYAVSCLKKT